MERIRLLSPEEAQALRAGEVLERPADALKELVENSLDAQARKVQVEFQRAGLSLIRVQDDGLGMHPKDVPLSILPHATSKLQDLQGLQAVRSLGFRGEALASIARVSRLVLESGLRGAQEGLRLEAHGAEVLSERPAPNPGGTVVEVRDLFYNTPVRRKFLRSLSTEAYRLTETLLRYALAFPEVAFSLKADGRKVLELPPHRDRAERIRALFGQQLPLRLFQAKGKGLALELYLSTEHRASRAQQYVFLNRRPIKAEGLFTAPIYQGLGLPQGRHPVLFLYLEVEPRQVDVNVHPRKAQVRLSHPEALKGLLRTALRGPQDSLGYSIRGPQRIHDSLGYSTRGGQRIHDSPPPGPSLRVGEAQPLPYQGLPRCLRVGESFWAVATEEGLLLLDVHAAHERVLYERLLSEAWGCQRLLLPQSLELPRHLKELLLGHQEALASLGLELQDWAGSALLVRAVPQGTALEHLGPLLKDLALLLSQERPVGEELRGALAARMACHRALRGSEALGPQEVGRLWQELRDCQEPWRCPHGRPTQMLLSLKDLRRMFKRT
jgi:DNA mismatch repair protein MutL